MLLWACGSPSIDGPDSSVHDNEALSTPDDSALPSYDTLQPTARLVRASLDIRGARPTLEELSRIEADPNAYEDMVEEFLADPRFGDRVGGLFAEVFQTRHEDPFIFIDYWEDRFSKEQMARSIGEEAIRIVTEVASKDLPITDLVTADWTMANSVLGAIWPITYDGDGETWQRVTYTDGRPAAGILSTNGMWWQFGSMENNLNRGRANQVSRIFFCADYLDIEVDFNTSQPLSSEEALGDAINTDPNCRACHDTLDPLAAHFFGFWYFGGRKNAPFDMHLYHHTREREWQRYGLRAPALSGQRTAGLRELGQRIAHDPRFSRCMVKHVTTGVLRRAPAADEQPFLERFEEAMVDGEMTFRALMRELVRSDMFAQATGEHGRKLMEPSLLSSAIVDLTGFRMTVDGWDLIRAPLTGYFPLAGGMDGIHRHTRMVDPEATFLLVNKRLAESAAAFVVANDLNEPTTARLLTSIDGTEDPVDDKAVILEQIVQLHARILSERLSPDDPRIVEEYELYREISDETQTTRIGWTAIISLLLRDPAFVSY
jgi:hypothetical protein